VLAAELSLAALEQQMRDTSRNGTVAYLAQRSGTLLAQPGPFTLSAQELALLQDIPGIHTIQRADQREWLAASAPVGTLGWTVVVAQPAAQALRPAVLVRNYTLFWLGVALALVVVLGALLSKRVTEPIAALSRSVAALQEGRAQEVEARGDDEIGQFARAFNSMAAEIVRWNSELQRRVEERTAELKTAQDQILRARRLAALGSLAAGLDHELNNPLTAISGLSALLAKDLARTPHAETLRTLQEQALRVSRIAAGLRGFADQERAQAGRRFALSSSVKAALELYDEELRARRIEVATDLQQCEAQGDPAQIQEAVGHLVQNAIQAMPEGGKLKVTLSDLDGDALKLTVSDTGKGIPAALRERIFDPFFTTKEQPGGVGLGLSISHSIVEAHHGKLWVESAEGQGATFTIVLPAAAAAAHLR
jgi:signal transduction histidine kinase